MTTRKIFALILLTGSLITTSCNKGDEKSLFRHAYSVPVKGNSWIAGRAGLNDQLITDSGTTDWSDTSLTISTYFKVEKPCSVLVALVARADSGKSRIVCGIGSQRRNISISGEKADTVVAGRFLIDKPGYNSFDIKGLKREGRTFGTVSAILILPDSSSGKIWFVKDDFYWGRRGPSVHFRYLLPKEAGDIKWFYNEITVPEGNDVIGSYFMADGFTDGYFGMQVNSEDERRILFSVWSPYKTDDPKTIPDEYRIRLLRKGEGVHTGEFGNEGSGGQSYFRYMWKAGNTYSFLLGGEPSASNSTDYTAWFFAPEEGKWKLIASFRKPMGSRYLGNLYSFLENFHTGTGNVSREGLYSNQWVCNAGGKWFELDSAKFTADATARKESRMDYAGGVKDGKFFLRNCGFFDDTTPMGTVFSRAGGGKKPDIDLLKLK